jgi:FMN reductase
VTGSGSTDWFIWSNSTFVRGKPHFFMAEIVLISGSPSATSRTTALLNEVQARLTELGFRTSLIAVRDLPADDLIGARYDSPALQPAITLVTNARAVVVGTPIYKASYTGVLKTFLDLLPQNALRGKIVLPIASGGSVAHLLAIDYALKPVLSILGASELLQGVYAADDQVQLSAAGKPIIEEKLDARFNESIQLLASQLRPPTESTGG